jgi:hypothetical protein
MEGFMHEYEIRILSEDEAIAVIEVIHLNDHAAVRAGRKFAGGKAYEVWRGIDCIYGTGRGGDISESAKLPSH